jgi:hypothetical protein
MINELWLETGKLKGVHQVTPSSCHLETLRLSQVAELSLNFRITCDALERIANE